MISATTPPSKPAPLTAVVTQPSPFTTSTAPSLTPLKTSSNATNTSSIPISSLSFVVVQATPAPSVSGNYRFVFEVNMTPQEFWERYGEGMAKVGVMEETEKERV
ncbi:hypothetical protein PM082_022725 [Marasmius tenuissimus]|nr:hypothetical protein PM082_022725 [Marasmius tenuissimus]